MPGGNLREFRRRVRSVKNIQQITRAMKFVAASKLRRAQERIFSARPYADRMLAGAEFSGYSCGSGTTSLIGETSWRKSDAGRDHS